MTGLAYFDRPRPRVFGHRGAAGVAPENTLPSFALAAALGAGYLELDVHATRDGAIVVLHDATLERTTDGEGPVADTTVAALESIDAGYRFTTDGTHFPYRGQGVRVPTLEAVLRAFPAHAVNIEIKQEAPPIVDAVLGVIARCDARDRVLLAAEHDSIMQDIRAAAGPRIATGMSAADVVAFMDRFARADWQGYIAPGRALQVPPAFGGIELVTRETVAAAHRAGLEVHVWTINDPAEIEGLLDCGADGIMSDLPGLVASAVAKRSGARGA